MFRTCPYCGGRLETIGGPDGNPFHANRKAVDVCKAVGAGYMHQAKRSCGCFGSMPGQKEAAAYRLLYRRCLFGWSA